MANESAGRAALLPGVAGKRCAHCNTHTTPLWRNGPDGPKTLCNACGVRDNRRHAKANRVVKPGGGGAGVKATSGKASKSGEKKSSPKGSPNSSKTKSAELAAAKKAKAAAAAAAARDMFAPKQNIHVPMFKTVSDYASTHAGGFKPPTTYLRGDNSEHALRRFGPGTAAPMYEASNADFQWLEHMNSEPLEGEKSVCATTPSAQYMRPEHLEKLFDVFEETSWEASAMLTQEQACHAVMGNVFAPANTPEGKMDDVLHWASNAHLGDGQLVNLKHEADAAQQWYPFDARAADERSNQSTSEVAGAPLTPSESVEFLLKRATGSGGGSVRSETGDDDSSTQSADDIDRRYDNANLLPLSENRKSSDLGTRAINTAVGMTRRGGFNSSIGFVKKSQRGEVVRGARRVPTPLTGGKSELKNAVKTIHQINARIAAVNAHAPSLQIICKVYRYWLKLRWTNAGKPLLARFDPVPPLRLRERPESATEREQLAYLFCMNLQAVSRQQFERAARAEQSEAQKKRRRRPCFNPAASKRRRRIQAAMDEAVARPLTITFDPLDELLACGWDVVEYDPEERGSQRSAPAAKRPQHREPPSKKVKRESSTTPRATPVKVSVKCEDQDEDEDEDEPPQADLKSPMGAAAARAGALMKNIVSSVGTAFGYGGKKCDMINGGMGGMDGIHSAPLSPSTPKTRRSTRQTRVGARA